MAIGLDPGTLAGLHRDPDTALEGRLNGAGNRAWIAIPNHGTRIERHSGRKLGALAVDFPFRHMADFYSAVDVGEIALVDNLTVPHASDYPRPKFKSYPIAVRYLF